MRERRQNYQPSIIGEQRLDLIDQGEMTQMVRPELDFKAIDRPTEWSCHNASVSDNGIERLTVSQQFIRAGANTLQGCQIEIDQFQAATSLRRGITNRCSGWLSFSEVPDRAD